MDSFSSVNGRPSGREGFQPAPQVQVGHGRFLRLLLDNLRPMRRIAAAMPIVPEAGELVITHVGHATNLIQTAAGSLLTDPIWSRRALLVKRRVRPGMRLRDLPKLAAILVSHAHFDHLDRPTLKRLPKEIPLVTHRGVESLLAPLGYQRVIPLNLWEAVRLGGLRVHAVPSCHWGKRHPWDVAERGYGGFVVESSGTTVYFGGDTAYFEGFKEIGRHFRIDVALLPIGAYNPFRHAHCNPEDAAQAFQDLGARHLIPYHWGTFRLSWEPLGEPIAWLRHLAEARGFSDHLVVLAPGQSARFGGGGRTVHTRVAEASSG